MSNGTTNQDRFYQRGLVLGFTIAEIFILIVFALLLAVAGLINHKDNQVEKVTHVLEIKERQLKEKENELAALKETNAHLEPVIAKANAFDDFFRELVLSPTKESESQGVAEKISAFKSQLSTLKEQARISERMMNVAKQVDPALKNVEEACKFLEARVEITQSIEQHLRTVGYQSNLTQSLQDGTLVKLLDLNANKETLVEQIGQFEAEKRNLQGQIRNLQRTMNSLGTGTEMPACWANPETGKPEFIFDITLTSTGIIVHDNALSNHVEDQARLPLNGLVYDQELTLPQFLSATRPLFDWSKEHGCRFFVRILDSTGSTEKDIYKKHLWTVGQHFYYFELRSQKS